MMVLKALVLGCVISHGHYPLNSPAQIDPTGCEKVTIRDNYIEYGIEDKKITKYGLWFIDGTIDHPIEIKHVLVTHNTQVYLVPNGTLTDGRTKSGCHPGDAPQYETVGPDTWMWCSPPEYRKT